MQEMINKAKFKTTIVGMGEDFETQYTEIEVVPFEFVNNLLNEIERLKKLVEECHIEAGNLEKQRNEVVAENEVIREMIGWIQCAACNQAFRAEGFDMMAHIQQCQEHPIYKTNQENIKLKEKISDQERAIKQIHDLVKGFVTEE